MESTKGLFSWLMWGRSICWSNHFQETIPFGKVNPGNYSNLIRLSWESPQKKLKFKGGWTVGRCISFEDGLFSGVITVSFRGCMCGGIACSFRKPLETLGHVMYIFPKLLRSDLKMSHRKNKNWGYTRVKQLEPMKTILDLFLLVMFV